MASDSARLKPGARATFSDRGPDETFQSSSWAGLTRGGTIGLHLLQSMQISKTAGAACHDEVFQCPAQ